LTTFRQAFQLALDLHPTSQAPVDMSWGRGGMWKGIRIGQHPIRCDANPDLPALDHCVEWFELPALFGQHTRELLVADPIFVDHAGETSAWRAYALRTEGPAADGSVVELLGQILSVARKLLHPRRGTLLLKIADQNHTDRPQRHAYEVNRLADELGLHVCGQWTMPSRSRTDPKRQTVRHFPSALHLFVLHLHKHCPYAGLQLVGRTRCAWCGNAIVVRRVGTHNYCCSGHRQAAYRQRTETRHTRERPPVSARVGAPPETPPTDSTRGGKTRESLAT
jgi:hypothetical protein